jgi:hypothetical protein
MIATGPLTVSYAVSRLVIQDGGKEGRAEMRERRERTTVRNNILKFTGANI